MLRDKPMILLSRFGHKAISRGISINEAFLSGKKIDLGSSSSLYQHKRFYNNTLAQLKDSIADEGIEKNHKLFEKQLLELEQERLSLFGSNGGAEDNINPIGSTDSNIVNLEEKSNDLKLERESLYDFTEEEKLSWTNAFKTSKAHSASLIKAVEKARKTRDLTGYDNFLRKDENVHFTHLSPDGDKIAMVDVGKKEVTNRVAMAQSVVVFPPEVMEAFGLKDRDNESKEGSCKDEVIGPKGPIFATAQIAGIMAAKRTSDLIPLCHPLSLDKVNVDIKLVGNTAIVECECKVTDKTGVEMEALVGASVAALTIYDMVKAISHCVRIEETKLVSKSGGKRNVGDYNI